MSDVIIDLQSGETRLTIRGKRKKDGTIANVAISGVLQMQYLVPPTTTDFRLDSNGTSPVCWTTLGKKGKLHVHYKKMHLGDPDARARLKYAKKLITYGLKIASTTPLLTNIVDVGDGHSQKVESTMTETVAEPEMSGVPAAPIEKPESAPVIKAPPARPFSAYQQARQAYRALLQQIAKSPQL